METKPAEVREFIDNLPVFLWIYSTERGTLWTNRTGKRFLFGDDQRRWPKKPNYDYVSRIHPDDIAHSHATMAMMMARPEDGLTGRYRMRGPDHAYHWLEFSLQPLDHAHPSTTSWIGMSRIIDQQVAREEDLKQQLLQEKQKREELERLLAIRQGQESAAMLAPGVIHDLNNILQTILLSVEISAMSCSTEESLPYADQIKKGIRKAALVCQQLITLNRGEAAVSRHVDTRSFFSENAAVFSLAAGGNDLFRCLMADQLHHLRVNPDSLHDCIVNLIVLMREKTQGRRRVELQVDRQPYPENDRRDQTGWTSIRVTEEGSGKHLERSESPSIVSTTLPEDHVSGMGLSLIARLMKEANGTVYMHNSPETMSCIEIVLPDYADEKTGDEPNTSNFPIGLSVLIIEDDASLRGNLRDFFQGKKWQVIAAFNIDHAMTLLHEGLTPDLILSDLDPHGTCKPADLLATFGEAASRHLIIMTGHLGPHANNIGMSGNDIRMLHKPFSSAELASTICSVLKISVSDDDHDHTWHRSTETTTPLFSLME